MSYSTSSWIFLFIALGLNAFANILLKIGSIQAKTLSQNASFWEKGLNFLNIATCAGILLFALNVLVYRKALANIPISIAYPIMLSVGLVIVILAARFIPIMNEKITLTQIMGIILIGIGVWMLAK